MPRRFFQRVQILALYVLDQRHRQCRLVRHLSYNSRNVGEPGAASRSPTALAGDDLVATVRHGSHQDWLHHALLADRLG